MATLRIRKKENNFVILDKGFINNPNLSLKAKGLLTLLLSFPDDWEVYVQDLLKRSKEGRDAHYAALQELKENGYITHEQLRGENGSFKKGAYIVHETQHLNSLGQSSTTSSGFSGNGMPDPENPHTENPELLNNKYTNNNKNQPITAATKPEPSKFSSKKNIPIAAAVLIGEALTKDQSLEVERVVAQEILPRIKTPFPAKLIEEICFALLNPSSFYKCKYDFYKKLAAIKNSILSEKWRTPASMVNRQLESKKTIESNLNNKISELEHARDSKINEMNFSLIAEDPKIKAIFQKELDGILKELKTHLKKREHINLPLETQYPFEDKNEETTLLLKSTEPKTCDIAAAVVVCEEFIGENLTPKQRQVVKKLVLEELQRCAKGISPNQLFEEICFSLVDIKSFSHSGDYFNLKLNAIAKVVREGKWTRPAKMPIKPSRSKVVSFEEENLNRTIRNLEAELDTCRNVHRNPYFNNDLDYIEACQKAAVRLESELKSFYLARNKLIQERLGKQII